jgi:Family of unknown function (DUF5685)
MIGHLKPSSCQLDSSSRQEFQNLYCSICASLRQQNSLAYSMLINNEFTLVLQSLKPYFSAEAARTHCPAAAMMIKRDHSKHPAIDKAARLSLLLAWIKATDWQADEPRFWKKWIVTPLGSKAKIILDSLSPELREIIEEYAQLTRTNSTDFPKVRHYSGLLSEYSFREIAGETAVSSEKLGAIASLFNKLGQSVSLTDHLVDLKMDMKTGEYNPIIENAKAKQSDLETERLLFRKELNLLFREIKKEIKALEERQFLHYQFVTTIRQSVSRMENSVGDRPPVRMQCAHEPLTQTALQRLRSRGRNLFKTADCCGECGNCGNMCCEGCTICCCEAACTTICNDPSCCNSQGCCDTCCDNCCNNCCDKDGDGCCNNNSSSGNSNNPPVDDTYDGTPSDSGNKPNDPLSGKPQQPTDPLDTAFKNPIDTGKHIPEIPEMSEGDAPNSQEPPTQPEFKKRD